MDPNRRARVASSPLLRAQRYQDLLTSDPTINSRADLARELGVTRARVTQVLGLLDLAPDIQDGLLALDDQEAIRFFSERRLRPLLSVLDPVKQVRQFRRLLAELPKGRPALDS